LACWVSAWFWPLHVCLCLLASLVVTDRCVFVNLQVQQCSPLVLITITRHRASTSMYSLTFCARVTTPPQYGQNGTAHAAGASMLSPVRGSLPACVACVCGMRAACGGPGRLPLGSAFPLCCHSNATRAPIANPPNSAQLGDSPYHSPKLHPDPCNSVGMRPRTDRRTDTQTHDHNTFLVVYDSREM